MRKLNVAAAMIVFLSTVQAARAGADAVRDEPAGPATRPAEAALLRERIESAAKALEMAKKMRQSGTVDSEEVVKWSQRWGQARLDAANTAAERTAILKELVEVARSGEAEAEKRFRAGMTSSLDVEAARYFRIDAELKLSRQLAEDDARAKNDKQLLQGTWKVVKKVKNGEAEELKAAPSTLKFAGDTVALSEGGGPQSAGTFTIDQSKTPKRITLTGTSGQNAGRTFEAIYELDGDTFKLAYGIGGNAGTPPKDFAGGQGQAVEVLERQKP
jgi:uncharacterized protein (TIGR03067 family)